MMKHGGGSRPMPEWRCCSLYQAKNSCEKDRASWRDPKRSGKPGRYFQGRELTLRIRVVIGDMRAAVCFGDAQSAGRKATGLEVIEDPRSAWIEEAFKRQKVETLQSDNNQYKIRR
jgi:hypothetical protein